MVPSTGQKNGAARYYETLIIGFQARKIVAVPAERDHCKSKLRYSFMLWPY
jgi:hypothetical protein